MTAAATPGVARVLTVAGSDSGGGAGLQADLATFAALGVFGTCAVTAVTAQNTLGVRAVRVCDPDLVREQIEAVLDDIGTDAAKTGMLGSGAVTAAVASAMRRHRVPHLVVDPVLAASTGRSLLETDGLAPLREHLLPLAEVVTPNVPEAALLAGVAQDRLASTEGRREAARAIAALGPRWVVIKGGHLEQGEEAVDLVFDGGAFFALGRPRLRLGATHGTGCTFSAALAAHLARGLEVPAALTAARDAIQWAIAQGLDVGGGLRAANHLIPAALPSGGGLRREP